MTIKVLSIQIGDTGSWSEISKLIGRELAYSITYHPQTQGVVERMNLVAKRTIRCLIHSIGKPRDYEKFLAIV